MLKTEEYLIETADRCIRLARAGREIAASLEAMSNDLMAKAVELDLGGGVSIVLNGTNNTIEIASTYEGQPNFFGTILPTISTPQPLYSERKPSLR